MAPAQRCRRPYVVHCRGVVGGALCVLRVGGRRDRRGIECRRCPARRDLHPADRLAAAVGQQAGRRALGDDLAEARFALGGVAHKPWRKADADAALRGKAANGAAFAQAADIVLCDAKGFVHNTFKIDLARRTIVRALSQAARGNPQSQSNKKIA